MTTTRPTADEHDEYYSAYTGRVPEGRITDLMDSQIAEFRAVLDRVSESDAGVLHDPYTWTIKQVVGHMIDVERVFSYRALRWASGDHRPIIGMDQNPWVDNTDYETPSLASLVDELELCRRANICLFRRLKETAWDERGEADGNVMTVRAAAYCLVGHISHHLEIIATRV